MYYWDLTLSSITMIHLVMSVGFSVDFSVHICHAFLSYRKEQKCFKRHLICQVDLYLMQRCLLSLGFNAFFSESYFSVFGRVMLLVIIFGLLHDSFFLPLTLEFVLSIKKWTSKNTVHVDLFMFENVSSETLH